MIIGEKLNDVDPPPAGLSQRLPAWIRLLRPAQWIKNGVVPAAYLFARWDPGQMSHAEGFAPFFAEACAVLSFCLVSSCVYIINDWRDREADALHPAKRLRPLASGEVSSSQAGMIALGLALSGFSLPALLLPPAFSGVLAVYLLMQLAYTFQLKRIPYVDVFVISIGFVLRAVAGATAISVRISPWLLLCTFLLSLFLALCKRRHEKLLLETDGERHREALSGYDTRLLDLQIAITASSTLVCYAIYTLSEETVKRFGTTGLGLTIPFVVFGFFRYLELVYRHECGGHPERVLLTDRVMILTVIGYLITVLSVFLSLD